MNDKSIKPGRSFFYPRVLWLFLYLPICQVGCWLELDLLSPCQWDQRSIESPRPHANQIAKADINQLLHQLQCYRCELVVEIAAERKKIDYFIRWMNCLEIRAIALSVGIINTKPAVYHHIKDTCNKIYQVN